MRTIVLTSTEFTGGVVFTFKESGELMSFDVSDAELSEPQSQWLISRCPTKIEELKKVIGSSKRATLTELLDEDVSFEMFWNRYNSKICSSKKKAKVKWDKMSKGERVKAFKHITVYERSLKPGIEKKYAETYLGSELWNN